MNQPRGVTAWSGCAELAARAPPLSPSFVRLHRARSSIVSGRRLFTTAAHPPSSALRALSPSRSSWGRVPRSTGSSRCAFVASGCGSVPKRSRLPPRGPRRPRRSTKPERSFRGRLFPRRPPLRSRRAKSSAHLPPVYSAMFSDVLTEGGCLCGAIRYVADGSPTSSMICHCDTCCRAAGSPVVAWLTFPTSRFSFVRGTPAEFHSTVPVTRTFCPTCGTSLTYVHADRPSEIDVTTSSLDNPEAFPPTHHSWLSDGVSWVRFGDRLPAYRRSSTEG